MRLRRYFGLLYGVLVLLIVTMGVWWVVFLIYEGRRFERSQLDHLAADRAAASYIIRSLWEIEDDLKQELEKTYPDLLFQETGSGLEASISPEAIAGIRREALQRQRMFTAEGIFFLALLAAGTTILTLAYRSEREFKRARELFLAGATHDLKTPLASLRLYTETLGRTEIGEREGARIRERMIDDIQRLEGLLEQILAVGYDENAGQGRATVLDLAEETERVLNDIRHYLAVNKAVVESDLPAGALVEAPRFVLALVVRNLIVNAVRHSSAPVRVKIALGRSGRMLRLSVQDRGPGIPRRDRGRIFEGFAQLSDANGGRAGTEAAGLGLYLVKRQTEMMGGRIELTSEVGVGSNFTLLLPAYEGGKH